MGRWIQSDRAKADILEIWEYIAKDSLRAADRFVDRLDQAFERLAEFPGLGRMRDELGPSLRSFPIGNYLIVYRPVKDGIEIARVLSGYRDIEALFDS